MCSSGTYSCLFDAVAKRSGYDAKLLRKATANFMLHNFEDVTADYSAMDWANLMVGGKQKRFHSPARQKRHVCSRIKTAGDLNREEENMWEGRRELNPRQQIEYHSFDDENSEEFDKKVADLCDAQDILRDFYYVYYHSGKMTYQTQYNRKKERIAVSNMSL